MKRKLDFLFVHASSSQIVYQDLSKHFSAIEPPIWAGLLAKHCRFRGHNVELIDCEATGMTDDIAIYHIGRMNPILICFVVYGQQPSASTQNMEGAVRLAEKLKLSNPNYKILFIGGHASALPREVLEKHKCIDFVCQNEGVKTLDALAAIDLSYDFFFCTVPGLAYRTENQICLNKNSDIVAQCDLEHELPGVAWDLYPMEQYRTSLWHSLSNNTDRLKFASIYTSLGCPFNCHFCCINAPFNNQSAFRFWRPDFMITELRKLAKLGIKNLKIADEMFVLRKEHYLRLCKLIIEQGFNFNIWAYARVDTIQEEYLGVLKKAGVNWLALGIETANTDIRKDVTKGRYDKKQIYNIVKKIREHGINVIGNYIFGLPNDTWGTMQETLDFAIELNTEEANFYCAMAYPGSSLYTTAKEKKWKLPDTYSGYSQHSYDCQPLPTVYLTAADVLGFRDNAWNKYHTNSSYLSMIEKKFGEEAHRLVSDSANIKLKRKLLNHEL